MARIRSPAGTATDAKYVARQPILDAKQEVVAYELLFRSGLANVFECDSPDRASSSVIADAFLLFGLEELTGGKRAFLNFSRSLLVNDVAQLLPRELAVVELLETIEPDAEVIAACRRLKARGYTLALDDFTWSEAYGPLVELADVVKVDFLATRGAERRSLAQRLRRYGVTLLAEKVETREDFEEGLAAGYEWFQGFFFSRPNILIGRDVRAYKPHYLRILELVRSPDVNLREVERAARRDVSLCYKLLRYVNSASFARQKHVESIRHALSLVGLDEVRKWVALLTVAGMSEGKPSELIRTALVRARFCEELAGPFGLVEEETHLFLVGLFSLIDALIDRPLERVLQEIPLASHVVLALRDQTGPLAAPYRCVLAWERGDWAALDRLVADLPGRRSDIPKAYRCALEWARESEEFVT
jgi:EAL and modified HD-GYP domain-containing signal transduction protein